MTKRALKITSGILALLCTATTVGAFSACSGAEAAPAPAVTTSTRLELPVDEILPTACTGEENLGYIATVLDSQTQYHIYSYTETNASIATQITTAYKDYRDGIMVSSDITYSSMVKTGTQACYIDGEAYTRNSATPNADTTHLTAEWNEGQPTFYTYEQHLTTYGTFPTELTQYIINHETIREFSEVVDNGDGTYTQSFVFDAKSAAYYSQYGMKKRGGLFGFPEFQSLDMSFTFDANWKILSYDLYEVAMVNKGVTVKSITDSHVEYFYEQKDFDEEHFAYYENFFKDYVGKCSASDGKEEEITLDATTLLSSGFAQVLEGGQQFEIALDLGGRELCGYVFLSLDLEDLANSIVVKLSLGSCINEQLFYFEYAAGEGNAYYGEDIALYVDVSTLKESIDQLVNWIDGVINPQPEGEGGEQNPANPDGSGAVGDDENGTGDGNGNIVDGNAPSDTEQAPNEQPNPDGEQNNGGETDNTENGNESSGDDEQVEGGEQIAPQNEEQADPFADLLSMFVIEETANGVNLSLKTDDLLGMGIGADLTMYFGVKGAKIRLYGLSLNSIAYQSSTIKFSAGIKATTTPVIYHDHTQTQANLADYVTDLRNMLSAETIKVDLTLDGNDEKVKNSALKGIYLDGSLYADVRGINLGADLSVAYTYNGNTISATINAVYDYELNSQTYGQIYLTLSKFNGVETSLNLYCDITEVKDGIINLLKLAGVYEEKGESVEENDGEQVESGEQQETTLEVAKLINSVLTFDYSSALGELHVSANALRLAVDVDNVLSQLEVDAGVKFGTASLVYTPESEEVNSSLSLSLSGLGFSLKVSGSQDALIVPEKENYFNLIKLVNLATSGYTQIENIIEAQDVYFAIDAVLTVDGLSVGVDGCGEVRWKDGDKVVVLSLSLFLIDGNSTTEKDVTELALIYDESLRNTDEPFVQMTINDLGLEIYEEDITYVDERIAKIASSLSGLFGGEQKNTVEDTLSATKAQTGVEAQTFETLLQDENTAIIFDWLFERLSSNGWVNSIKNGLDLKITDTDFMLSFLSSWAVDVALDAKDGLNLTYSIVEKGTPVTEAQICVKAGDNTLKDIVRNGFKETVADENGNQVNKYNFYTTKQCTEAFTRLVYNYYFATINNIDVTGILGDGTYNVHFAIDGNNCNIPEMQDVYVRANLYFTNVIEGGKKVSKLKEIDIDVNTVGAIVKINIVYQSNCFYLKLPQIQNIILSDFKVKATTDVIYETLEGVIGIVADTNILSMFGGVSVEQAQEEISTFDIDQKTLVELVATLLTFDYDSVLNCSRVDGMAYAQIDLDGLTEQLGVAPEYELGDIEVKVNQLDHTISTVGIVDGKRWIELRSELTEKRDYSYINPDDYVDSAFLPVLIEDARNFATNDDGEMYKKFSFSGTIKAKLVKLVDLTIDVATLTMGIDEENGFYISLLGDVAPAKILGIEVVGGGIIGFTYANGYITIARKVSTAIEYRVMSIEYFIDNLFTASDISPLKWLFDVSDFGWDQIIANAVKGSVDLNSGLSTPEEIYLYNNQGLDVDTEILVSDYIKGITVNVNGNDVTTYGDADDRQTICDKLGISSNYYGMNLDAETITEGVLTQIYAAIFRDDKIGITGIKAQGAIASYVDFTINLDKYAEGATVEYASNSNAELYRTLTDADIMREVPISKMTAGQTYYVYDEATSSFVAVDGAAEFVEGTTYYKPCMDGVFTLSGSTFAKANDYVQGTQYYTFYVAPNFYKEIEDRFIAARDSIEYRNNVSNSSGEIYDEVFGGYNSVGDTVAISKKLYSLNLTVYDVGGQVKEMKVKAGSTIYLYDNAFPVFDGSGNRIAYVDENGNLIGKSMILSEDRVIYAQAFAPSIITVYNNGQHFATIKSFIGDEMPSEITGYTMVSDALYIDGVTPITAGMKVDEPTVAIYGEFVQTQVTVNSVVYTFDFTSKSYYVSATVSGIHKYADANNVLALENTIGAYKVTAIGEGALACSSSDPEKSIKNIIVPANITKIGKTAFANNVGIKSIIFLAESVHFDGKKSDNSLPLYGCSNTADGKYTDLYVYYTNITTNGADWGWYRTSGLTACNIGGSSLISGGFGGKRCGAGTWSLVKVEKDLQTTLENVNDLVADINVDGLINYTYDTASAQANLSANIKAYTAEQFGYINGQKASVWTSKNDYGYTIINVSVIDQDAWYEINVVSHAGEVLIAGDNVETYNGKTYAKGEIALTATARKGYKFDGWNDGSVKDNPATFTVQGVSTYTANYISTLVPVKVYSKIDFTYDGNLYQNATDGVMVNVAKEDGTLYALNPTADGYLFAGWAKIENSIMQFTALDDESAEYYAIWVKTSAGSVSVATSGVIPADTGNTFYGWYADSAFTSKVSAISTYATVLYARQQYSFSFSITGGVKAGTLANKRTDMFVTINGTAYNQSNVESYTWSSYTILEGDVMTVVNTEGNSYKWQIICGNFSATVYVDYMSRKSIFSSWSKNSDYTINPSFATATITGDLSLTFSH